MRAKLSLLFCILIALSLSTSARIKTGIPDAAHLRLLLKKLTVVGNVLYVGAHPDDENTAILAYLSLGRLLGTGYLALNRGEGGQNLIGTEQGDQLGVIRTQELLAARQIDYAEQFFTRAVDFGFSKSPQESLNFWGHQEVLSDVVWIFRKFRPDVIITRFPRKSETHGHHTASSILAEEAFAAAGDPSQFPEQLKYVSVWKPKRLVWNRYSWGNQQITEDEKNTLAKMEIGEYNPILGKSYTEIAGISRSMHKSQGFGDSEDRGKYTNYFQHTAGDQAQKDLFEGIDLTWNRIPDGPPIGKLLEQAAGSFNAEKPEASIPLLLKAHAQMNEIKNNPWVDEKKRELLRVIQGCSGLWLEAISDQDSSTPGSEIQIDLMAINRSSVPMTLQTIITNKKVETANTPLIYNTPVSKKIHFHIDENASYSQPYWLIDRNGKPFASVKQQTLIGLPESPPAIEAQFNIKIENQTLAFHEPVLSRKVDPVKGEIYKDFVIVPEAAVNLQDRVQVFPDQKPKSVRVDVISGSDAFDADIGIDLPDGWKCDPPTQHLHFDQKDQLKTIQFQLQPQNGAHSGQFNIQAKAANKVVSNGRVVIDYPHIPAQTLFPEARGELVRVDVRHAGEKIGYIMGSGDAIPDALRQIGYQVTLLSDDDLLTQNLSRWDAIILGIRAYNTRRNLYDAQEKLMEYVRQGGTLIVQYQTTQELGSGKLGPYPFRISRQRVSVESAPVTILKLDHPVLNFPNKITPQDFDGWIQERGLYFADQWDPQYETILSSNDPAEAPLAGGMLYARYGKGIYIFTAYSWFRELPAGVPGAYRIFANLVSAGKR
jgi:LmbE family N-acetylglucosaminyl deacetylase